MSVTVAFLDASVLYPVPLRDLLLELAAEHPDVFLARLCRESPSRFLEALDGVRARLRNPPVSPEHHLDALRRAGLNETATEILSRTATQSTRPPSR